MFHGQNLYFITVYKLFHMESMESTHSIWKPSGSGKYRDSRWNIWAWQAPTPRSLLYSRWIWRKCILVLMGWVRGGGCRLMWGLHFCLQQFLMGSWVSPCSQDVQHSPPSKIRWVSALSSDRNILWSQYIWARHWDASWLYPKFYQHVNLCQHLIALCGPCTTVSFIWV